MVQQRPVERRRRSRQRQHGVGPGGQQQHTARPAAVTPGGHATGGEHRGGACQAEQAGGRQAAKAVDAERAHALAERGPHRVLRHGRGRADVREEGHARHRHCRKQAHADAPWAGAARPRGRGQRWQQRHERKRMSQHRSEAEGREDREPWPLELRSAQHHAERSDGERKAEQKLEEAHAERQPRHREQAGDSDAGRIAPAPGGGVGHGSGHGGDPQREHCLLGHRRSEAHDQQGSKDPVAEDGRDVGRVGGEEAAEAEVRVVEVHGHVRGQQVLRPVHRRHVAWQPDRDARHHRGDDDRPERPAPGQRGALDERWRRLRWRPVPVGARPGREGEGGGPTRGRPACFTRLRRRLGMAGVYTRSVRAGARASRRTVARHVHDAKRGSIDARGGALDARATGAVCAGDEQGGWTCASGCWLWRCWLSGDAEARWRSTCPSPTRSRIAQRPAGARARDGRSVGRVPARAPSSLTARCSSREIT